MSPQPGTTDGRNARRERNREAVIDAFIELQASGIEEPSVDALAEKAGVSYRSVYRYFDDRSDMMAAAAERAMKKVRPLLSKAAGRYDPYDPLEDRIVAVVAARLDVYQQLADVMRMSLARSVTDKHVAEELRQARTLLRQQIGARFILELRKFSEEENALRLTAIDQMMQFDNLDYVIHEQGHTREEVERYLRAQIRAILTLPSDEFGAREIGADT